MVKTVTVRSEMKYEAVVKNLERLGELRVESSTIDGRGNVQVIFRERTLDEFFKEILPWNKKLAVQSRRAVLDAFESLLSKEIHSEQLLQNIKDRVEHNVGVTGYALKCDYQPVLRGARPSPLQGGTVATIRKGNGVHLIEANPAKIKCDHAVLLTSTAITELSQHPAHSSTKDSLNEFVIRKQMQGLRNPDGPALPSVRANVSVNLSAPTWACVTDLELPFLKHQATLDPTVLSQLLEESIGEKKGAVVVEIIPDSCECPSDDKIYSYSDKGLRSQIAIARKLVDKAKKSNQNLNITFACKDRVVLQRMRTLNQEKVSSQIGIVVLQDD
jgi:hypothetical protein